MNTEVIFQSTSKGKGNIYFERAGKSMLRFNNGVYKTSSREEINDILNSDLMSRNLIKMITPAELVDTWLRGEHPDRLNETVLSKVNEQGLIELAKVMGIPPSQHGGNGAIIKSMVRNKPISNAVMFILDKYKTEEGITDWLKIAQDNGLVYKSGPWFKYRKGDQQNTEDDLSLGRKEEDAQKWCIDNQKEIEERIK
jgi:hypothetical protein